MRIAVAVVTPLAEIVTFADLPAVVVMVKVAEVAFAGTVPETGVWATAVLELESVTTIPPLGAGPLRVTVAVELEPAVTEDGDRLRDWTCGGVMVRVEDALFP